MPTTVVIDFRGINRPLLDTNKNQRDYKGLEKVCGLSLLIRNLLLFQRKGYQSFLLLAGKESIDLLQKELLETNSPYPPVQIIESNGEDLYFLKDHFDQTKDKPVQNSFLYWPGALTFGRFLPDFVQQSNIDLVSALVGNSSEDYFPIGDLGLQNGEKFTGAFIASIDKFTPEINSPQKLLLHYGNQNQLQLISEKEKTWQILFRHQQREVAEKELLFSLRKPADGLTARYDRHISLYFSKKIMHTNLSPNFFTIFSLGLGILAGIIASFGGYFYMLIGALLFQTNSILDGIDGEIARAKLLESKLGEWLDTIGDDLSNLVFLVLLNVGLSKTITWLPPELFIVLAWVTGICFTFGQLQQYSFVHFTLGSGDINSFVLPHVYFDQQNNSEKTTNSTQFSQNENVNDLKTLTEGNMGWKNSSGIDRILFYLKYLVKRDTFTLAITILAIVGQLWLVALGGAVAAVCVFAVISFSNLLALRTRYRRLKV